MAVINITNDNYQNEVVNSDKPVLLDFYADWCGPCKRLSPLVDEIAETAENFKVGKVDVQTQPELAQAFGVSNIPTLAVVKDGKIVNHSVGAISKDEILNLVNV